MEARRTGLRRVGIGLLLLALGQAVCLAGHLAAATVDPSTVGGAGSAGWANYAGNALEASELAGSIGSAPEQVSDGWRSLASERVVVHYQGSDSARAARALAAIGRIPPLPGIGEHRIRPDLWVAPTREVMDSLVGGRVPEWGAAVAVPSQMFMVIPGRQLWPADPVEEVRILRHEWAHLALHDAMDGLRIPRWFNEGYAEWSAGGWQAGGAWKLRVALALGGVPALDSIAIGWPAARQPAEVAYLLSASVIEYLVSASSEEALGVFLERWRQERSFDRALRSVFGATVSQLESDWRKHVKRRYGWLLVVSQSAVFWAILSGVLAAVVLMRRRYRREQMARLRAGEPPDAPAYWTSQGGPNDLEALGLVIQRRSPEVRVGTEERDGSKDPGGG